MGLDDVASSAKEEQEEEDTEEMKDKLGVEDLEDMEEIDDRLIRMLENVNKQDKKVEDLEKEIRILKSALSNVITQLNRLRDDSSMESLDGDNEEGEEDSSSGDVKNRWQ